MTIDLEFSLNRLGWGRISGNKFQAGPLRVSWWDLPGKHSVSIELQWKRKEKVNT